MVILRSPLCAMVYVDAHEIGQPSWSCAMLRSVVMFQHAYPVGMGTLRPSSAKGELVAKPAPRDEAFSFPIFSKACQIAVRAGRVWHLRTRATEGLHYVLDGAFAVRIHVHFPRL